MLSSACSDYLENTSNEVVCGDREQVRRQEEVRDGRMAISRFLEKTELS